VTQSVIILSNCIHFHEGLGTNIIHSVEEQDNHLPTEIYKKLKTRGNNTNKPIFITQEEDYNCFVKDFPNALNIAIEYDLSNPVGLDYQCKNFASAVSEAINDYLSVRQVAVYVVKSGDTLWSIAKKFSISIDKLKELNNLDSNLVSINQQLVVE